MMVDMSTGEHESASGVMRSMCKPREGPDDGEVMMAALVANIGKPWVWRKRCMPERLDVLSTAG